MRAVWMVALLVGCGGGATEDEVTNDETAVDSGTTDTGAADTGSTDSGGKDSGGSDSGGSDSGGDSGTSNLVTPGFESELSQSSACSDTWVQVWDPEASLGLELYVSGITAEAGSGSASRVIDLSDPGNTTFAVVAATPIADNYCTDALVEREVHERWDATGGTLTVTVDASQEPQATIELSNVVFSRAGDSVTVSSATWSDIPVMTMWGG
jgi:hypothetical protein